MTDRIGYPHTINQLFKEVDASRTGVPYVAIVGDESSPVPVRTPAGQLSAPVAPVSVTAASAVSIAAANANRTELRVHNQGPGQVAIGATGLTWAARVVVISAGDFWVEDSAPAGAWVSIAAPGTVATVSTQEVTK